MATWHAAYGRAAAGGLRRHIRIVSVVVAVRTDAWRIARPRMPRRPPEIHRARADTRRGRRPVGRMRLNAPRGTDASVRATRVPATARPLARCAAGRGCGCFGSAVSSRRGHQARHRSRCLLACVSWVARRRLCRDRPRGTSLRNRAVRFSRTDDDGSGARRHPRGGRAVRTSAKPIGSVRSPARSHSSLPRSDGPRRPSA